MDLCEKNIHLIREYKYDVSKVKIPLRLDLIRRYEDSELHTMGTFLFFYIDFSLNLKVINVMKCSFLLSGDHSDRTTEQSINLRTLLALVGQIMQSVMRK